MKLNFLKGKQKNKVKLSLFLVKKNQSKRFSNEKETKLKLNCRSGRGVQYIPNLFYCALLRHLKTLAKSDRMEL